MISETNDGGPSVAYGRHFATIYDDIFPREAITERETGWLGSLIARGSPVIVELGVGTGRVALPLVAALEARGDAPEYLGVDVSPEMLGRLRSIDSDGAVTPVVGDIVDYRYPEAPDAILCVCGTISMVTDPEAQAAIIARAADALCPGGVLIVETHDVDFVRRLHVSPSITYAIPYPGAKRALVTFSSLEGVRWLLDHVWIDDGTAVFPSEESRLTSLGELDDYAGRAGLSFVGHTRGLDGSSATEPGATVTAVYRKE